MTISTARATRLRITAAAAVLAAGVTAMSGCSATAGPALYQDSASGWEYVLIDGEDVVHIYPNRETLLDTIDALEANKIDREADYVEGTGKLNDAGDTVLWTDGGTDPIRIDDDMIVLDGTTYVDFDSDQAVSMREAEVEDWHKYND